jgi:putative membrane protein
VFDHSGGMIFGGGFMWLFWIVLVVIIVLVIRSLNASDKGIMGTNKQSPLEILKERYARGEINEDEFKRMRKELDN